ncbi:MAG TPA: GNAT family N-acetyltransferase [Hyphomicrobiaceae bacterium]|nr:GNAT family N-acetyltransferase [Hyphomicrobiaceae bacterium]
MPAFELRRLRHTDRERFAALAGAYDVARCTSDIPFPFSAIEATSWIDIRPGDLRLAIVVDGELVGAVGYFLRPSGIAELGYWIGMPWWGRGLATATSRVVVDDAFRQTRIPAFSAHHFADNPASGRILMKLGFAVMGQGREFCRARSAAVDTVSYWLARA